LRFVGDADICGARTGCKQHQVDGSRQLVGEQEIGLSKEQDDKLQQTAEGCEANQKVDSNGGAQELRGESQIAGLAPFLDVPAARFKELASDTPALEHVVRYR
jgi:hypothetical protein